MKAVPPCLPKSACPEPGAGMLCEAKAASHGERRWQAVVVQPVCEMVQSLKQVAVSPVRLATGLASYTEYVARGRGKVFTTLESNPP